MPSPPDYQVTPAQLSRYQVPAAFLAQFAPRGFEIQISTGGALGTMAFVWRRRGETNWNNTPIVTSPSAAPWPYTLEEVFADLTFAVGNYVASTTYVVDEAGAVTGGDGLLSVSRFDLRDKACSAVTTEALTLMQNAVRQPLLTWGDDARTHAAAMVFAALKRGKGSTANGAGVGDENIFTAEALARAYFIRIGEKGRPPSMTDSSATADGPLLHAYPIGDDDRNWRDAW